jgi:hypothetical protein
MFRNVAVSRTNPLRLLREHPALRRIPSSIVLTRRRGLVVRLPTKSATLAGARFQSG